MSAMKRSDFTKEFQRHQSSFSRLRTTVFGIIQNALVEANVDHLPLQSRVKEEESAYSKANQKKYTDPFNECTDFVALRIIVFLESDVDKAETAIRRIFEIDEDNSTDKRRMSTVDTVGYRSLHLICSLGQSRKELHEYHELTEMPFEVQIRTTLQHAWAEIEHKRNYKGEHSLPTDLQHRLMILAGTLELVDKEFAAIAAEADNYATSVVLDESPNDKDKLSMVALETIFLKFMDRGQFPVSKLSPMSDIIIEELSDFGIEEVDSLKNFTAKLARSKSFARVLKAHGPTGPTGLFRTAMILCDFDRYLRKSYNGNFSEMPIEVYKALDQELQRDDFDEMLAHHGIFPGD